MNPSIPQSVIDKALETDPIKNRAEYLAEFRQDIEGFIAREAVLAFVMDGIYERPHQPGLRHVGFVDPSGGSADSFTLCICHRTADQYAIDLLREVKPPFSPETACAEFATLLRSYKIHKVIGDRYAGAWPVEQFRKYGIRYEQSAKPKSDLYRDLVAVINSRRIELLDHPRAIHQLCSLERHVGRSGRDTIDHPLGQHDDLANCIAGTVAVAEARKRDLRVFSAPLPYRVPDHDGGIVEFDRRSGRPLTGPHLNLVRYPDGSLHLVGGDNSCRPGAGIP